MDVPNRKVKHGSTSNPQPLRSSTPVAMARHLGRTCVRDTPDLRQKALAGAPEIQSSEVLRYMGMDIYLQGAPIAPATCRRSEWPSGSSSAPRGSFWTLP